MDLRYSETYEAFRSEVRAFLKESWPLRGKEAELPRDRQAALFRDRAIERGYAARSVPRKYGGSEQPLDALRAAIISEEFAKVGAPGDIRGIGASMLVPTLLEHGTEEQCRRYVPPTIRGEMVWCQGYSEPGAGSDLASLKTRGELDGEEWVVTGHKIWTSGAHFAHMMFALVRTEPAAEKHSGISYLLIDMRSPGVEVRPLRQMTGTADFNEVFLNAVRVPKENIVGRRGEGWKVSRSTLKHERNMIGDAASTRTLFEGLVELARQTNREGRPAIEDPSVRRRLAEIEGYVQAHLYSGYRQLTCAARGESPGIAATMNKLVSTTIGSRMAGLAIDLVGDAALLAPEATPRMRRDQPSSAAAWVNYFMWSLGISTAGGTANIQRNIIAERGLGLPRDLAAQGRQ
jgi:alkylation response protein AidB-like acyl-CoA dehydrogenase